MNKCHALVPLKRLAGAKSRLAGLLSPGERAGLARAMAEDVLSVLTDHRALSGVTLLSDDEQVLQMAEEFGIDFLPEIDGHEWHNWRWSEQWIPHGAWFFLAIAALGHSL